MKHPQAHIIEAYADTAYLFPSLAARALWVESKHFPGVWDRTHIEYVITHPEGNYAIGERPASKEKPVQLKPGQTVYISVPSVGNFVFNPDEWKLMSTMSRDQLLMKIEHDFGGDSYFDHDHAEITADYILHRFLKDSK